MVKRKIKRSLLEEILHELNSLNGLKAFDTKSKNVICDTKVDVVPTDEIIQINLNRVITLLSYALGEDNIHIDCQWYDLDRNSCINYRMGKYAGLAYEVSRHEKCIKDIVGK